MREDSGYDVLTYVGAQLPTRPVQIRGPQTSRADDIELRSIPLSWSLDTDLVSAEILASS